MISGISSRKGKVLMELGEYPFSKKYGWTTDRFGVSWQVILDDGHYRYKQKITPTLMFVGKVCGKAEDAMKFYASVFPNSKAGDIARYTAGMKPDKEGTVMHGAVMLDGQEFFTMDSAREHNFSFNEAVSFMVRCKDQKESDYYWKSLSKGGEESVCGWLKDKYGLSWQIVPADLEKWMKEKKKAEMVMKEVLQMKKLDFERLKIAAKDD